MSNLVVIKNNKNEVGINTNKIELTNSQSSALDIKKSDNSYSFLEFNTSSNTIGVGTSMSTNDVITFKGTTKITTLSKGDIVYLNSSGNWVGLGTVGIGSYIQVNSGGTGLQWTGIRPSIALLSQSPSHNSTISSNSDNIILTFDEPIIAGTGNIVLTPSSGSAITIDVTNTSLVSFSSNVCTINPSSNLDATGLTYTVTMNSGVIKNSNGDLFNGISGTTYQFNSKDTQGPPKPSVVWPGGGNNGGVDVTVQGDAVSYDYSLNEGGSYSSMITASPSASFTLPIGTYAAGKIYVRSWDSAGNSCVEVNVNPSEIVYSGFGTTDIRHYIWIQNLSGSSTRGHVGYALIKQADTGTTSPGSFLNWILYAEGVTVTNKSTYIGNPSARPYQGSYGVNWDDNTVSPDEHIWKLTRQSNGSWKCENTAYGWDLDEYSEGANYIDPTQHSSSTVSDPIWLLKKYNSSPAKYLTTQNTSQNSYASTAYNNNYGYQRFNTAQTNSDKQKWRFEFSLFTIN